MNPGYPVKIFVASGSELKSERKETIQVIHELRKAFPALYLEPVEWETDLPSGSYDKQRLQDQINPLLEPCAVVVVLFYSNTGAFTVEEYRLAREKNKKVFLYFKSGFSPKNKSEHDHYGKVLEFREEIEKENRLLFKEYDTLEAFKNILYNDLVLYLSQTYIHDAVVGNGARGGVEPIAARFYRGSKQNYDALPGPNAKVYHNPLRIFEDSGNVIPGKAYYVPLENVTNSRNQDLQTMIDQGRYFSIFAPRQSGKTTFLKETCSRLQRDPVYIAIILSFQTYKDLNKIRFYSMIEMDIYSQLLKRLKEVNCEKLESIEALLNNHHLKDHISFRFLFEKLNQVIQYKKIVIFIDEFDGIPKRQLENFLHVLRDLYQKYKDVTPKALYSIGLVGIRNITKLIVGGVSPFNIADQVDLPPFSFKNIRDLYAQYTEETFQPFTEEAVRVIYEETAGQPWLVNRLGTILTIDIKPKTTDSIDKTDVEKAIQHLLLEKNSHFDNLYEKAQLYKETFIEVVFDNVIYRPDDKDQGWLEQYGLIKKKGTKAVVANNIYKRRFTETFFERLKVPTSISAQAYSLPGGLLDIENILLDFAKYIAQVGVRAFYQKKKPYEKTGQFLLTAWLYRCGDLRYEVNSGLGRMDILLNYKEKKYIIETKVNHNSISDTLNEGKDQVAAKYLASESYNEGFLVIFDTKTPVGTECKPNYHWEGGKKITVFIIGIGQINKKKRKKRNP